MIGRTNAVGDGGAKVITGTFTSSSTVEQQSFSVTGVGFDPKAIWVSLKALRQTTEKQVNYRIVNTLCAMPERNRNVVISTDNSSELRRSNDAGVSVTRSGTTVTVTLSAHYFSSGSGAGASNFLYGDYEYFIVG